MLFSVKNIFKNSIDENIEIIKNERYGIINTTNKEYILQEEYDNIFIYGINTFVLYKGGKIGLCRIENNTAEIICNCEYDVIDNYSHNLFLSNETNICYYNPYTKTLRYFDKVNIISPYFYCEDKEYQYIIDCETSEIIYQKPNKQYNKSCYIYCGNTKNGPVFYDCHYSMYIYPTNNGYTYHECPLHHPF